MNPDPPGSTPAPGTAPAPGNGPAPTVVRTRGFFAALGRLVAAHPALTVVLTVILTGLGAYSALQLKPATGIRDMLADDQPAALALGKLLDNYALIDDLIVLAQVPDDQPADPDRLTAFADRLGERLADEPTVARYAYRQTPEAVAFVENVIIPHGLYYLDPDQREALRQRLAPAAMAQQFEQNAAMVTAPGPAAGRIAEELIKDPLRLREFMTERAAGSGGGGRSPFKTLPGTDATISADGRALLIRVAGAESANDLPFTDRFMGIVRAAVADVNADADALRVDYTGAYAIAEVSANATREDMIRSCIGSLVLLIVLFLVVYKNPLTLPLLLLPVYVAITVGFGIYALVSGKLTPVTAVSGAVLAGLGIDYCVHYLAHYQHEYDGVDAPGAVVRATERVGPAILAACVTTLIGFGALLSCGVRSLREFSLLGLLGLAVALAAAVTVMPAMLLLVDRFGRVGRGLAATRIDLAPLVRFVLRHANAIGWSTASVLLACVIVLGFNARKADGWGWPVSLAHQLNAMHPHPHPPLETQDRVARYFDASPDSLTIHLEADSPDDLLALSHRVQAALVGPDLRGLGLGGVTGPATLLPDPTMPPDLSMFDADRVLANFNAAADASVFNPKAFDPYRDFLRTLLTDTAPPTMADLRAYPDLADAVLPKGVAQPREGLVLVTLSRPWASVDERNNMIVEVRRAIAGLDGATLTGISVVGYDTQEAIGGELTKLILLAGGLVFAWMLLTFRRPGDVALALLPAGAALILMFTAMAILDLSFNGLNLITVPLIVGIGVDDGIFLTHIHRRARREHLDRQAFLEQLAASAHAVFMTSLTTGLAFGSLAFTRVPAIQSLGWLTALGVFAALLTTLFALMPIMAALHRERHRAAAAQI